MTTWTNSSRTATTWGNQTATPTTWDNVEQSGTGWIYNEPNLTYNATVDPDNADVVYYNGFGTGATWTNLPKS